MSIEDGMKEYNIIIEEGSAGMGKYIATAICGSEEKTFFVHQRSEKAVRSFIYSKMKPIQGDHSGDYSISLKRLGPVNPGKYIQDGEDERDAIDRLVGSHYADAVANFIIEPGNGIGDMKPEQIAKEIYQNWRRGKGVQIIPPAQMELDLFEKDD